MQDNVRAAVSAAVSVETVESLRALNDGAYIAFNAQLRESFLQNSPPILAAIHDQLKGFLKGESRVAVQSHLGNLCNTVQLLRDNARIAGFARIAAMTRTLAVFLKMLQERPETINPSTVRTVTHTVDFLNQLFARSAELASLPTASPLILVIDDEADLARLICAALEQAEFRVIDVDDPSVALRVLALNRFDLIFLDIKMPGIDGFELCSRLRTLANHQHTPVVFLTGLADFEHRAQSILAGGNDLIAKPFLPTELVVKALAYVYKSQLQERLRK